MSNDDSADDQIYVPELVEIKEEYYYDYDVDEVNEEEEYDTDDEQPPQQQQPQQSTYITNDNDDDISTPATPTIPEEMLITHLHDIPACWSEKQCNNFKRINRWLLVKNGKLGCKSCMMVRNWQKFDNSDKGVRPPNVGWLNCGITFCGQTFETKQSSLRKKIFEHKNSKAHIQAVLLEESIGQVETDEHLAEFKKQFDVENLTQLFGFVYDITKQKRSFDDFVQLCSKRHRWNAGNFFTSILDYIASQFRNFIATQLTKQGKKIAIVIHESGMVDQRITLAVHLKLHDDTQQSVGTLFFDLIGHASPSSEEIVVALLNCLRKNNLGRDYLKENLVGFFFQQRSTLVGSNSKFGNTLLQFFPNTIIKYIANRSRELEIAKLHNAIRNANLKNLFTTSVLANTMFLSAVGPDSDRFDVAYFVENWIKDQRAELTQYTLAKKVYKIPKKISNDMALAAEAHDDERLVIDLKAESNSQETSEEDAKNVVATTRDICCTYDSPAVISTDDVAAEPDTDNVASIRKRKRTWRQAAEADNRPNDLDKDIIETIVQRVRDASDLYAINEDKDRLFLLSLLPFMKQLSARENLEFRTEVQQLLKNKIPNKGGRQFSSK